jgi:hypothetical protein
VSQQAREFARDWKHCWFGFWGLEGEATGRPFALNDHTDPSWAPTDLAQLVSYLKSCPIAVAAQQSPVKCGFCDQLLNVSTYRSNGTLVWSDSLAHLVEKHAFVLPDAWVEQIRRANYVAPSVLTIPADQLPWPPTD